jgi:hypothetical protein
MTLYNLKRSATDVWITPRWVTSALGPFDLDPCAADPRPWDHAETNWAEADDGLAPARAWFGRVWMNPPYSKGLVDRFIDRFVEHNDGIACVFPRTETRWFQRLVVGALVFLLAGRISFCRPDGSASSGSFLGSVFVARGEASRTALLAAGWDGTYLRWDSISENWRQS